MNIQRRLSLSFLLLLLLYGMNSGIYYWGNEERSKTVEALRKAQSRQTLLSAIKLNLTNLQMQVTLLSQVMADVTTTGLSENSITQFKVHMTETGNKISKLKTLSDGELSAQLEQFDKKFQDLNQSWLIFYENFGVKHARAITELAIHADPLSTQLMGEILPQLYQDEESRVERAITAYYQAVQWADKVTAVVFSISILISGMVAFLTSRYISRGLDLLKDGAEKIGDGLLSHRISIASKDELGSLAKAFNEMGQNLFLAETELKEVNNALERRHQEVEKQRKKAESLLLNILPLQIAEELKSKGIVDPKYFEDVTIMFTDFVGFTASTEKLAADELVSVLHDYFTAFDHIAVRYGLEKLKTIGDSYMCVSGLPERHPSHPVDMVLAAQEMIEAVLQRNQPENLARWSVRIGIHTGSVIAGIVGIKKFSFDIWGNSVNYAKLMESSGIANRINLSERSYYRVKDFFSCTRRGQISTKGGKSFNMFLVEGILPTLSNGDVKKISPVFLERYRMYFQKTLIKHKQA